MAYTETDPMPVKVVSGGSGGGGGGAVTLADGADVTQGAKADAVASAYNASASAIAILKRISGVLEGQIPSTPVIITGADGINPVSDTNPLPISDAGGQITVNGTLAVTQSGVWDIDNITGSMTLADGADSTFGAKADAAAAAYNSTATHMALTKRMLGVLEGQIASTPAIITGADGINAVSNANPLPISDAGGAVTVNGTLAATQSGAWDITNITGSISLPSGAATETSLAKLTLGQGSTTAGQTGPLLQGAVTTAAPAYTNAQTRPLSLTTDGALRVDTGLSLGAVTGTYNTTRPTLSNGNTSALQLAANGELVTRLGGNTATSLVDVSTASDGTGSAVGLTVNARLQGMNATPAYDVIRTIKGATASSGTGVLAIAAKPNSDVNAAITPTANTAAASNVVLKASAGNVYGVHITTKATAGYLFLFDATALPSDGAITPKRAYAVAANTTFERQFNPPLRMANGAVLGFGSGTDPFVLAASATAFLSGDVV